MYVIPCRGNLLIDSGLLGVLGESVLFGVDDPSLSARSNLVFKAAAFHTDLTHTDLKKHY